MSDGSPQPITPRWEWRSFGTRFGDAEERLAAFTPGRVHESDELYLISRAGRSAVKIRDGMMDIKRLKRVDDDGLELWMPMLKAPFPLDAATVRAVWEALALAAPRLARDAYTHDRFLSELVGPEAGLRAVAVHKRRRRYALGDLMVELTDVRAGAAATRTIAAESERPERVLQSLERVGLDPRPNVNYPTALAALAGVDGERAAVIDVGTNSVKLLIGERIGEGPWSAVEDRAEVTRLGEGLAEDGTLQAVPMARTIDAICDMAGQARRVGAFDIAAVGTAGLRIAANSREFLSATRNRCGIRLEVISGDEESRFGYLAAKSLARTAASLVVFETGGGSSQFTFGTTDHVDERWSVDVGAACVTDRFGLDRAVPPDVVLRACAAIAHDLTGLAGQARPDLVIGIGGAFTNLAAVTHGLAEYEPEIVHGTVLEIGEIDRQIALFAGLDSDGRAGVPGLQPARAPVILAGACIVRTVLDVLGVPSATVSDRGLRHGLMEELLA